MGHDLAGVPGQNRQQLEFLRGELDLLAGAGDPMTHIVDLDLAELRTNPRIGLLRLAHPLKAKYPLTTYGPNFQSDGQLNISTEPQFVELRQFVTAAVLATGQDYAPLLPPLTAPPAPTLLPGCPGLRHQTPRAAPRSCC